MANVQYGPQIFRYHLPDNTEDLWYVWGFDPNAVCVATAQVLVPGVEGGALLERFLETRLVAEATPDGAQRMFIYVKNLGPFTNYFLNVAFIGP